MTAVKLIPRRTLYALNTTISASSWATRWERIYRQVFWLSDGGRDSTRIAILLHKPEAVIEHIVEELAVTGFLSLHTDKKALVMNAELLKQSFEMVAPRKEEFAHSFYQRLFTDHFQTRALFAHTDMKRLEGALMATLAMVVAGVERGENLIPILRTLGTKHTRHGVRSNHYPLVGAALLETFHEYLGLQFIEAMQDSWSQAFELISIQMLKNVPVLDTETAKVAY
jgi:hemoglobin-like flavoprotein